MKTIPSFRDIEKLSAYLDDRLSKADRARLESRLSSEPQLSGILTELRQARELMKSTPRQRVPRNFTLTPKMAGIRPPLPRSVPVFRFASIAAAVMLFVTFAVNFITPIVAAPSAQPVAYGMGGGCDSSIGGNCGEDVQAPQAGTGYGGGPQETATPQALTAMSVLPEQPGTPTATLDPNLRSMEQPTAGAPDTQLGVQGTEKSSETANRVSLPMASELQLGLASLFILFGAIAFVIHRVSINKWQKRQ